MPVPEEAGGTTVSTVSRAAHESRNVLLTAPEDGEGLGPAERHPKVIAG